MTEEVQDQEVQQSSTTAEDEAGFEAGFAEARGDEPPTAESQPEVTPDPNAETEPEVEQEQPVLAGLTESQIKAALAKANEVDELRAQLRQIHGRYGDLNGRLTQMQQSAAPREVTAEMFEELNAEFPELAAGIAKGLSKLPLGGQPQTQVDLAPIEEKFTQGLDRIQKQAEIKLLSMKHRDWQTIRESDDFKVWEGTLPEDERNELENSWDALYLSDQFDRFKGWRDRAQAARQTKQKRLEAATTPRGVVSTPPTVNDDDAFFSGFKQVRRA
jgi:hypothetical protein